VLVLRDGFAVRAFGDLKTATSLDLVQAIVGRAISEIFPHKGGRRSADPTLEVSGLVGGAVTGVTLEVHSGEIVGLGGLEGHGQRDVLRLLFGLVPRKAGSVRFSGKQFRPRGPRSALAAHVGYLPQERKTEALLLTLPIEYNLTLPVLANRLAQRWGLIRIRAEQDLADQLRQLLRIDQTQWHQTADSLSGGNQQKVALGRWVGLECRLLLLDDPTRGVDIGTRAEIYRMLRELADKGQAILCASSDSGELLGLCDRVYVLYEGSVIRELAENELNEANLTAATLGLVTEEVTQ
jgi:ribose transport system ATP-binding protein